MEGNRPSRRGMKALSDHGIRPVPGITVGRLYCRQGALPQALFSFRRSSQQDHRFESVHDHPGNGTRSIYQKPLTFLSWCNADTIPCISGEKRRVALQARRGGTNVSIGGYAEGLRPHACLMKAVINTVRKAGSRNRAGLSGGRLATSRARRPGAACR